MGLLDDLKKKLDELRGEDNSPAALRAQRAANQTASQATAPQDEATPAPPTVRYELPTEIPQIAPRALYERQQTGESIVLLDVRMPWDHAAQHPAGATSLPINELELRVGELDPAQHYVLSCYHGISSQDAVAFLLAQGFPKVESLEGGFSGWASAGLPIAGEHA